MTITYGGKWNTGVWGGVMLIEFSYLLIYIYKQYGKHKHFRRDDNVCSMA